MVSEAYYSRLAQIESGGDPKAKNPKSSASGLFQFTKGTAAQYGLKDPFDPAEARIAVEKFTQDNARTLESKLGRAPTEGELYLAHQQGAGGALKLLQDPNKKAIEVVGTDQVLNNGGNQDMTAAEFAAKWTGKFGDITGGQGNETLMGGEGKDPIAELPKGPRIQLPDGKTIQLTGAETPDQILRFKQKLFQEYGSNINVDRETGADPAVRAFVGSVFDKEDKLNSLRKYYPDAIEYGEDNYVFTNPQTGKYTLYNPKGLDMGDVASIAREGFQAVGSAVGATGGAIAGGIATGAPTLGAGAPVGIVAGAMGGAGLGSATAGSAFDFLLNKFGLTADTRTASERALDFAGETAVGTIGEGIGRAVGYAGRAAGTAIKSKVKSVLGGGTQASKDLLQKFGSFGIDPSASLVSGSQGVGKFEMWLQQNAAAADILTKQADDVVSGIKSNVDNVISQIGQAKTKQGAGQVIRESAVAAAERFNFKQEKIYDEAFNLIGSRTPVSVPAVQVLRNEMASEIASAPNSLKPILGQTLKQIDNIVADAQGGGIPFETLRQIRTAIGRDLASPQLSGSTGSQNEAMKRVYGALTEDMSNAAASTSTDAAKKLKVADRYTRQFMTNSKDFLQKIANFDADEKAFSFALNASKDGGSSLARLRKNFKPEEWDTIAASVLDKLGDASYGAQGAAGDTFSVNQFLTNWNKLAPEAKQALFGGKRYAAQKEALEKLTLLMEKVKDTSRFANTSNTGGALQTYLLMSTVFGGTAGALTTGDVTGAAKGAAFGAGAVLSGRQAAKLLTSPKFVEWLAEPIERATTKEGYSIASHLARLAFIAEAQPEIAEEIDLYTKALKQNAEQ